MEKFTHREAIEIQVAPGSIDTEAIGTRTFPVEAWEFEVPETTTPELTLKSPWVLVIHSTDVLEKLKELEARLDTVAGRGAQLTKVEVGSTIRSVTVSVT